MVRVAEGRLVPVLLDVLLRCEKGSPEQFLTLLVLNNISIPNENKRLIALEYQGMNVLSQLLCAEPSCHLVSIVLVNLTFCDAETTRELMSDLGLQLVESLALGLRIASLTQLEYEHRQALVESDPENPSSPAQLLANMLTEDQRQRISCNAEDFCLHMLPPPSQQLFPETAQWTMSAIKNLTRPCNDPSAAQALIRVGIVPHIFRFITVSGGRHPSHGSSSSSLVSENQDSKSGMIILSDVDCDDGVIKNENAETSDRGGVDSCDSSALTPVPSDPMNLPPASVNSPTTWDSGSAQDAALFVVLNLSATPSARECMRELDAIHILTAITNYYPADSSIPDDYVKKELLEFQRLKARMALSYLIGSEGHYGQSRARKGFAAASAFVDQDESCLIVTDGEVTRLVELLATALHHRAKDGAGGYSAATFSVKYVLFSLRCLLTHYENQVKFAQAQGAQVNALLMKVLAQYSLQHVDYIDEEGAEHAAFSLYLLSNYCFTKPFLPSIFGGEKPFKSLTGKVLTAYLEHCNPTPAGKHAAEQVLLRYKHMIFEGTPAELAVGCGSSTMASDFRLENDLVQLAEQVAVEPFKQGARPDADIFNRPLLRRRPLTKGGSHRLPWDNLAMVDTFPNALVAVQELSFASTKVRHIDRIDDVLIANNIVHSANGEKTESYNYMWSWQDTAGEIQRNLEQQRSSDSFAILPTFGSSNSRKVEKHLTPALSLLDSLCGPINPVATCVIHG